MCNLLREHCRLNNVANNFDLKCCNVSTTLTRYGSFTAPSEFYVFVGVMAFVYSLAAVLLYVFADDKYRQMDYIPCAVSGSSVLSFSFNLSIKSLLKKE